MGQLPASSRPVPRPSPLPSVSDGTEFVEYFCERIQSGPLAPMGRIQPATHKCLSQLNAREQKIEAYRLLRIDQGITIGQHNGAQSSTGLAYTVSGIVQFINDFSGTRSGSAHAYEEVWLAAALSWVCPFNIHLFYVPRNTDTILSPIEKPATKEMALVVALLLRHEELVEALLPSVDLDIAWRVAFLNISPVEAAARTAQCKVLAHLLQVPHGGISPDVYELMLHVLERALVSAVEGAGEEHFRECYIKCISHCLHFLNQLSGAPGAERRAQPITLALRTAMNMDNATAAEQLLCWRVRRNLDDCLIDRQEVIIYIELFAFVAPKKSPNLRRLLVWMKRMKHVISYEKVLFTLVCMKRGAAALFLENLMSSNVFNDDVAPIRQRQQKDVLWNAQPAAVRKLRIKSNEWSRVQLGSSCGRTRSSSTRGGQVQADRISVNASSVKPTLR